MRESFSVYQLRVPTRCGVIRVSGRDCPQLNKDARVVGVVGTRKRDTFGQSHITSVDYLNLQAVRVELRAHNSGCNVETKDLYMLRISAVVIG